MKNPIENLSGSASASISPCLENPENWNAKLDAMVNSYNALDLLGEKEIAKIEEEFLFKNIPQDQKRIYAEVAGRLALGFMNHKYEGTTLTKDRSLYEMHLLRDRLPKSDVDIAPFLHALSFFIARENDTNTHGRAEWTFSKIVKQVAIKAIEGGDQEVHNSLINPFHLESGMEIFRYNRGTEQIESSTIDVLIDKGDGLVAFGEGESGQEDIETFNLKLSRGFYMKKDGTNYFGGVGYSKLHYFGWISEGSVLKIDESAPPDQGKKIVEVAVIKTNRAELEEKYGQAYLAFINKFPRNKGLFIVNLKTADGQIFNDLDVRGLKLAC